jgi:ABC-type multidrug transport system ATPase subunit
MSEPRRCPYCGVPLAERDRVCFSCHRAIDRPASPDGHAAPGVVRQTGPAGPSESDQSIELELIWGRDRRACVVPAAGATIGSTAEADIVVPATFLAPLHARVALRDGSWNVESLSAAGSVLLRGDVVRRGVIVRGEIFRLADRIGNFVTVKVPRAGRSRLRDGALRAALPGPGESYLIGSEASCPVRLDHPLVQAYHVAVRREDSGTIWLEDRRTAAGTYINGQRLRGRQRLATGDIIQIGPFSARVGSTALEPLEQVAGVDISVRDASVDAPHARNGRPRTLLHSVSLELNPATMTAVAGPSGAGKTTLMRLLSGQLAAAEGVVEYNGADLADCRVAYAALMGYVPQEDVVHADLTVMEALGYQARLRLGSAAAPATRLARVERVITLMGLTQQRSQLVKTLSGGQRKRVSIACELLSEPQILFLDEPTSGLDPGLDKRMMLLLRLLADQGRTVVLTTHAIAHVDVCDTLVLVGVGGYVIYAGPPEAALDWFGVQSLSDVFALVETPEAAAAAARRAALAQVPVNAAAARPSAGRAPMAGAPAARHHAVRPVPDKDRGQGGALGGSRLPVGSAAWRGAVADQGRIFAGRYVRLLGRDRAALAFSLLQGIAVAVLTALVAPKPFSWDLHGSAPTFVFGCASVWFGMISAVRELVKEKGIWRREFLAGGSLPAYLASKVGVLSALLAFQSLTLTIVLALTLGLPASSPLASPFLSVFGTLWLAGLCGMALGLLVSATAPSADRAMSLVPYLLITQLVLCGVLFPLGAMTFASWLMPARWSVSALGGIAGLSAATLHQSSGLYPHSAVGLLSNWIMLILLSAGGIALTAWSLQRQGAGWSVGAEAPARPGLAGLLGRGRPAVPAAAASVSATASGRHSA